MNANERAKWRETIREAATQQGTPPDVLRERLRIGDLFLAAAEDIPEPVVFRFLNQLANAELAPDLPGGPESG